MNKQERPQLTGRRKNARSLISQADGLLCAFRYERSFI